MCALFYCNDIIGCIQVTLSVISTGLLAEYRYLPEDPRFMGNLDQAFAPSTFPCLRGEQKEVSTISTWGLVGRLKNNLKHPNLDDNTNCGK